MIAFRFGLLPTAIHLTDSFFSRMTNEPPRSSHDEYWHVQVDKVSFLSQPSSMIHYCSSTKLTNQVGGLSVTNQMLLQKTSPHYHYVALIYLSDYGIDFTGGRFIYSDSKLNLTVEPKFDGALLLCVFILITKAMCVVAGRVSAFTSGWENPHVVERVMTGTRFTLTIDYTCDKKRAMHVPNLSGTMPQKKP
ncbi:OGFOD3 [Cordylochernes scorpioides]|uniref:OGFOD3 n=1 Tax=Cordylochernes scorpioides TaxID=51811 RepID=A0ABY6LVU3_9ARAC|nr:OGFOD3 [Cordylochernes scorpioides]